MMHVRLRIESNRIGGKDIRDGGTNLQPGDTVAEFAYHSTVRCRTAAIDVIAGRDARMEIRLREGLVVESGIIPVAL